jgi:hypothetical protein
MVEEMSFEEQFPELVLHRMFTNEEILHRLDIHPVGSLVFVNVIQKYCLSKQRVKEAVDKILPHTTHGCSDQDEYNWSLKKELGLDE